MQKHIAGVLKPRGHVLKFRGGVLKDG